MSKYVLTIVFGILGLILGLSNKIVKIEDKKEKNIRVILLVISFIIAIGNLLVQTDVPEPEFYMTNGDNDSDNKGYFQVEYPFSTYYTLEPYGDPKETGIKYKKPFKVEKSCSVRYAAGIKGIVWGTVKSEDIVLKSNGQLDVIATDEPGRSIAEITAYLKDGSVCTGSAIVCNDIDETERGERLLYIENDAGLWSYYESEFERIEYIDYSTGEQVVMEAEDSGEENKETTNTTKDDASPKLKMNLMNEFWTSILRDPQLEAYWEKKENLELTQEEGWAYIDRLSDFAVDALQKTLNTATLPDGILYWNIAQAVIPDFLREVSDMIYEIQVATWKKEDLEMGINAGFQQAPFNEEKMQSIINMMVNNSMKNAGVVDDEAE